MAVQSNAWGIWLRWYGKVDSGNSTTQWDLITYPERRPSRAELLSHGLHRVVEENQFEVTRVQIDLGCSSLPALPPHNALSWPYARRSLDVGHWLDWELDRDMGRCQWRLAFPFKYRIWTTKDERIIKRTKWRGGMVESKCLSHQLSCSSTNAIIF